MAIDTSKVVTGLTYNGTPLALPTPSGRKTITDTTVQDVSAYAEAQVVDANLVAANIADGVTVLGITGTHQGGVPMWDDTGVNFIDYDGTLLYTWKASEVVGKLALPENPSHTGLVAQGWNWTLEEIKQYETDYPEAPIYVGQLYKTASGKTEFDITVTKVTGLTVPCNMVGSKDWGDGTADSLTEHTYADYGDYTIKCDGSTLPEGSAYVGAVFGSDYNNVQSYFCTAIRFGENVTEIASGSVNRLSGLETITMHRGIVTLNGYSLYLCKCLKAVVFPKLTSRAGRDIVYGCDRLRVVSVAPNTYVNLEFTGASTGLEYISMQALTGLGANFFNNCIALRKLTFNSSVSDIYRTMFAGARNIVEYDFTKLTAVPTLADVSAFNNINALCKIKVPAALYSQWIAATNWSTYADYIVGV